MPKQIVIAEQHRTAAVFSEDQIQELIVATGSHQVSDIYLGTVENVLPGIDAAFINIGDSERNGFMHVSDLGPLRLKRSAGSITELVAPQQKVLVQIMKEPTGNKGPRLTGKITMPGRYLVLMPYGRGVNLSRRIREESERSRLRALAILIKPAGMGLLVRTEAEGVSEDAIIEDLESLKKQWENVQQQALATRAPALLNRDDDFVQRVLRDVYSADVNRIVTDSHLGMKRVRQHLSSWNEGRIPTGVLIDHHRERTPILEYFRVNAAIREALKPRVDLPSGGYIIIEPTEALTVIDVNSGSFTRSATSRETVLWTNCEAAVEIARQLRLRNVAGVIIVDFIDMDSRRDQMQVLESFNKALRSDKARPQISQLSELGLVELTRKRQGQNIYELFGQTCPTCGGLGHLVHLPGQQASEAEAIPLETSSRGGGGSSARSAQPLPRDTRAEELEPHSNPQELELLNHPSYQERGSKTSGNRRRRRRDTPPVRNSGSNGSGSNGKDAPSPPTLKDSSASSKPAPAKDNGAPPKVTPSPEPEEAAPSRTSRSRSGRSEKPASPPQEIAVEMTPDEQRVYATMGISPLVLSSAAVEDSKNVQISVVLPGEAKKAKPGPSTPQVATLSKEIPGEKTEAVGKADSGKADSEESASGETPAEAAVAIATPELDEDTSDATNDATNDSGGVRRRRRRRSSAATSS